MGSRHVLVSFYVCETTDVPPMFCLNVQTDTNFHIAYPEVTGAAVMKFHFSFHVKATHRRHVAWSHQHKIEPKYV